MLTFQAGLRLGLLLFSLVALLIRSRSVLSRGARPMWLALLALTVELFLLQAPVAQTVDRWAGNPYLAVFIGGFCHMALTMVIWTLTVADPRSQPGAGHNTGRWWFAGVAVAVMLASEVLATLQHKDPHNAPVPAADIDGLTVAWAAYLTFLGVSSGDATFRLWRQLRMTSLPTLRLALAFLSVGTSASLVYVVARAVTVAHPSPAASAMVLYSSTLYFLCFTAGCVSVLARPFVETTTAWWQRCRLYHLWSSLTQAVPGVVFEECPTFWQDLRRFRGNKIRLQRRVVEIQDAALTLRSWVTPEQVARIVSQVATLGLDPWEAEAVVAAQCLRLGRAARESGLARSEVVPDVATGEGSDIHSELRWLMRVRRAYEDGSPVVATS